MLAFRSGRSYAEGAVISSVLVESVEGWFRCGTVQVRDCTHGAEHRKAANSDLALLRVY